MLSEDKYYGPVGTASRVGLGVRNILVIRIALFPLQLQDGWRLFHVQHLGKDFFPEVTDLKREN
jgi:hypothetical protein